MNKLNLNPEIEDMFNGIAESLNLECKKMHTMGSESYNFIHDNAFLVRFSPLVDMKGRVNLLVNFGDLSKKPSSLGLFEKENLMNATRQKVIITVTEAIKNKNMIYKGNDLFER